MRLAVTISLCAFGLASAEAGAVTLSEFYGIGTTEKGMYLAGVYDSNVILYEKDGRRSECLTKMGGVGFVSQMVAFVRALPSDASSSERKVYDSMNVALIATLVIDKACSKAAK